jgi:carbamate kinase
MRVKEGVVVIALGGHAIKGRTKRDQANSINQTMQTLGPVFENMQIVYVHGNGPQVGEILYGKPSMPMHKATEITQALIGRWIQEANTDKLLRARHLVAPSMIEVMAEEIDLKPRKPVGRVMSYKEMQEMQEVHPTWTFKEDREGYRRFVASPRPKSTYPEHRDLMMQYLEDKLSVIAHGGGGSPYTNGNGIYPVEGVVDKDNAASMIAKDINATHLVILTDVPNVMANFRQPNQHPVYDLTLEQAIKMEREDQFGTGMSSKMKAAINYQEAIPEGTTIITDPTHIKQTMRYLEDNEHKAGTILRNSA